MYTSFVKEYNVLQTPLVTIIINNVYTLYYQPRIENRRRLGHCGGMSSCPQCQQQMHNSNHGQEKCLSQAQEGIKYEWKWDEAIMQRIKSLTLHTHHKRNTRQGKERMRQQQKSSVLHYNHHTHNSIVVRKMPHNVCGYILTPSKNVNGYQKDPSQTTVL